MCNDAEGHTIPITNWAFSGTNIYNSLRVKFNARETFSMIPRNTRKIDKTSGPVRVVQITYC